MDLSSWTDQEVLDIYKYIMDDVFDVYPELREMLPTIEKKAADLIPKYLGDEEVAPKVESTPTDASLVRQLISEFSERDDTRDIIKQWTSKKPDDRIMGIEPISAMLISAGIYFILSTEFEFKKQKEGQKVKSSFKIKRRAKISLSFIQSIADWLIGK